MFKYSYKYVEWLGSQEEPPLEYGIHLVGYQQSNCEVDMKKSKAKNDMEK